MISENFLLQWYNSNLKFDTQEGKSYKSIFDKESGLYSKKSDRKFRELVKDSGLIDWLNTAEEEDGNTATNDGKTSKTG